MTVASAPTPRPVRSADRLEAAARKAAYELLDLYHPERAAPIPVELIAQLAGYRRAANRSPDTSAVCFTLRDASGKQLLGINTSQGQRSQNFALAHALAHGEMHDADLLICHQVRSPLIGARERDGKTYASDEWERQANLFAAELLMPADTVFDLARRHLDGVENPRREDLLRFVAGAFKVPDAAVAYRLVDLAILTP